MIHYRSLSERPVPRHKCSQIGQGMSRLSDRRVYADEKLRTFVYPVSQRQNNDGYRIEREMAVCP